MIAGLVVLAPTACKRAAAPPPPVQAQTSRGLAEWRRVNSGRHTADEWREFDAMLQEIRLGVMVDREATGSEAIDAVVRQKINGRSFAEVLAIGYGAKRHRLVPLRDELKKTIDGNAWLVTKEGDAAGAAHLASVRARQERQLQEFDAQIAETERQLLRLEPQLPKTLQYARPPERDLGTAATPVSRERAREEIGGMIERRRAVAQLQYGAWPVRLDPDGASLTGEDRAEFERRRVEAATTGHVVIAVSLKNQWWIYDEPKQLPAFSPAVLANLTEQDRREIENECLLLQAEVWARMKAKKSESESESESGTTDTRPE
ncbi:hypothetical protein [Opitutus sp. ER46]|uniref:hypothetical protein n=1 Tax=Opitutus sp. ER46 TaxID=2161864 RepID=UPI000D30B2EA|nr:hypothetical protein [Opitutus sp. ER46]PTX91252.1 hypothetical protein DB354_21730 [Opitutus sp. ER46]